MSALRRLLDNFDVNGANWSCRRGPGAWKLTTRRRVCGRASGCGSALEWRGRIAAGFRRARVARAAAVPGAGRCAGRDRVARRNTVGGGGWRARHGRGRRRLSALHRDDPARRARRRVAGVALLAAAGDRRAPHQQRRRRHELGPPRAGPAHARVRSGHAGRCRGRPAGAPGREPGDAGRRSAHAGARHAGHCGRPARSSRGRRHRRCGVGSFGHHAPGGLRERVFHAGIGPSNEQAARVEDRSLGALRARRRHQRAGRGSAAGHRPHADHRRRTHRRSHRRPLSALSRDETAAPPARASPTSTSTPWARSSM